MDKENVEKSFELEKSEQEEECRFCKEPIQDEEGHECSKPLKCSVCGDYAWAGDFCLANLSCGHLIAGRDDADFSLQITKEFEFPTLKTNIPLSDIPKEELLNIFGESYPLIDIYNKDLTFKPDEEDKVWEILTELVPDLQIESFYEQHPASMLGWGAEMLFADDPDAAREKIEELLNQLKKGMATLSNKF